MISLVSPLKWIYLLIIVVSMAMNTRLSAQCIIEVPANDFPQHVAVLLPKGDSLDTTVPWQLTNVEDPHDRLKVQLANAQTEEGTVSESCQQIFISIPPTGPDKKKRTFRLEKSADATSRNDAFCFAEHGPSLQLFEEEKPVLTYNFGVITNEAAPKNDLRRSRACYIHPLWGLNGEILTEDSPLDHLHHHGVFWAWPYVTVGETTYDLWMYSNIQQKFVRWLYRSTGSVAALMGVENGWFVGDRKVVTERVWISAYRSEHDARAIDLSITLIACDQPVTIEGEKLKCFGGLTFRYNVGPQTDTTVRIPGHALNKDVLNTPLAWADITSRFPDSEQCSGASIFIHPNHPNYPPTWLTRRYGALCVGWPGLKPYTLEPGKPISLNYRIWIHRSEENIEKITQVYASYCTSQDISLPHVVQRTAQ